MSEDKQPAQTAEIELDWAGSPRTFHLRAGEIRRLQIKTGFGLQRLLHRMIEGDWLLDEVIWTLRLALEGGGTEARRAQIEVEDHCVPGRIGENVDVAKVALYSVLDSMKAQNAKKVLAAKTKNSSRTQPAA